MTTRNLVENYPPKDQNEPLKYSTGSVRAINPDRLNDIRSQYEFGVKGEDNQSQDLLEDFPSIQPIKSKFTGAFQEPSITAAPKKEWEELRRMTRQLELQLRENLVNLDRMTSKSYQELNEIQNDEENPPIITNKSLENTIEGLLRKFESAISEMSHYVDQSTTPSSSYSHTILRCKTLYQDFTQEFMTAQSRLVSNRTRANLLRGAQDYNSDDSGLRSRTEMLLREKGSLLDSNRLADEVLGSAEGSREALSGQRQMLFGSAGRINSIASTFPALQQVMNKIGCYQNRDTVILAIIIAVCFFLLFLYWANKNSSQE